MDRAMMWWKKINNSAHVIHDIVTALLNHHSVFLLNNKSIPFSDEFHSVIEEKLSKKEAHDSLKSIDMYEYDEPYDVADFLMEHYCSSEVQGNFFPRKNYSKAKYLAGCSTFQLNNSFVWVKNVSNNNVNSWFDFINKYQEVDEYYKATFIIEVNQKPVYKNLRSDIHLINASDYYDEFDYYVYCFLLVSEIPGLSKEMKSYAAELISSFGLGDVERCVKLCEHCNEFIGSPGETINELGMEEDMSETEISSLLWKAQNKTIFPIIESMKNMVVERYLYDIKKALPFQTPYKIEIYDPYELDLGNILSMYSQGRIKLESGIYQDIRKLRDIRSSLAHMKPVTYDEVESCFEIMQNESKEKAMC